MIFIDRQCPSCHGNGCTKCHGTGMIGSANDVHVSTRRSRSLTALRSA